ncbi:MAG TPA: hypothetical protein VEA37_01105, partial [Flavobacterium sp.]|nr:hypothetical protein [Flavobacterium sp.]
MNSLIQTQPAVINLPVPYGGKTYTLNLARVDIVSPDFSVVTDKGSVRHSTGVQYRGIVDNNPAHIASLSITLTEKAAFFSTSEGNFVIAKEKNDYVVYNQKEMPNPEPLFCETPEVD